MPDDRSLFERDYAFLRTLAKATALAVLLPKGFITRSIEGVMILIVLVLAWGVFTGPATPPPLSIVKVDGPVSGLDYRVSAPDGEGVQIVDFANDLDVRVKDVRFECTSSTVGRYELLLDLAYEPHTSARERVYGNYSEPPPICRLKSYETYAP